MNQFFINSLQNPESYDKYVKEYLDNSLSALANSGQRFNIRPNGIKCKNITCGEILNRIESDGIAEISINVNNYTLSIKVNNKDNTETIKTISFNNVLTLDPSNPKMENIQYIFNHIDEFSGDSYIQINGNLLTAFLRGKLNQEDNESELIYFQFDINTNILMHYITTKYYGILNENESSGKYYIVYKFDYNKIDNNYILSTYLFTLEFLVNEINDVLSLNNDILEYENNDSLLSVSYLKKFYDFTEDYIIDDEIKTFSMINNIFVDYDKYLILTNNISEMSFLNFVFCHKPNPNETNFIKLDDIILNKDEELQTYSINHELTNQSGYITNNDITKYLVDLQNVYNLFYQLYIIFNEQNYFSLLETNHLYKHIIYNLYLKIRENYSSNDDKLYIPLNYSFNCLVNDQNENIVYYVDNIYVKTISNYNINNVINTNKIYYYNKLSVEHIDIYNIDISYNTILNNTVINTIIVNKLYTLPFLNNLNNWVIDNDDTNISMVNNQYTGIKQLYMYSVKQGNSYNNVILNITDDSILSNINYKEQKFKINPNLFYIYSNIDIYCFTGIPEINSNNKDFFKNTMIISISSSDNIENINNNEYNKDYQLDYVYSLWKPNFEKNEFELITLSDSENIENSYAFDPFNNYELYVTNNYKYKYINGFYTYKQNNDQSSNIIEDNYMGILRNKQGTYYNPSYSNDYNFILEYLKEQNIKENGDNNIYDDKKFIDKISNIKLTNIIYPKYSIYNLEEVVTDIQNTLKSIDLNVYTVYVSVAINSDNEILIEVKNEENKASLFDLVSTIKTNTKNVEFGIFTNYNKESNIGQYFNELVFDQDIPSLDLKEVFIRNTNNLNRINILGVDKINNDTNLENLDNEKVTVLYNGYIGTNYYDSKKDTLHISTSNENINIGYDTLLNLNQINKFNKYKTLSIDEFENFIINLRSNTINNQNDKDSRNIIEATYNNILTNVPIITNFETNNVKEIKTNSNIVIGNCICTLLLNYAKDDENNIIIENIKIDNIDPYEIFFYDTLFIPIVLHTYDKEIVGTQDFIIHKYKLLYNTINLNKYIYDIYNIDISSIESSHQYNLKFDNDEHIIKLKYKYNVNDDTFTDKILYLLIINDKQLLNIEKLHINNNQYSNNQYMIDYSYKNLIQYSKFKSDIKNNEHIYNHLLSITIDKQLQNNIGDIYISLASDKCIDINNIKLNNDNDLENLWNIFINKFNNENIINLTYNNQSNTNIYNFSN